MISFSYIIKNLRVCLIFKVCLIPCMQFNLFSGIYIYSLYSDYQCKCTKSKEMMKDELIGKPLMRNDMNVRKVQCSAHVAVVFSK